MSTIGKGYPEPLFYDDEAKRYIRVEYAQLLFDYSQDYKDIAKEVQIYKAQQCSDENFRYMKNMYLDGDEVNKEIMKDETYEKLEKENIANLRNWEGYSIVCIKDFSNIILSGNSVSMTSNALSFQISKCSNDKLDPGVDYECASPGEIDDYIK